MSHLHYWFRHISGRLYTLCPSLLTYMEGALKQLIFSPERSVFKSYIWGSERVGTLRRCFSFTLLVSYPDPSEADFWHPPPRSLPTDAIFIKHPRLFRSWAAILAFFFLYCNKHPKYSQPHSTQVHTYTRMFLKFCTKVQKPGTNTKSGKAILKAGRKPIQAVRDIPEKQSF